MPALRNEGVARLASDVLLDVEMRDFGALEMRGEPRYPLPVVLGAYKRRRWTSFASSLLTTTTALKHIKSVSLIFTQPTFPHIQPAYTHLTLAYSLKYTHHHTSSCRSVQSPSWVTLLCQQSRMSQW